MSAKTTHRIFIAWLILALLFAQGLRVCMHAYDAPHAAEHDHEVSAAHLESTFSMGDGHGEEISDNHISLIGILKHLTAEPLLAALFITLLLVLLPLNIIRFARSCGPVFHPSHGHYFSPPLRAPPR